MITVMEKDTDVCSYAFYCSMVSYDVHKLIYGFSLGINKIVSIQSDIDRQVPLSRTPNRVSKQITGISPGLLADPYDLYKGYRFFGNSQELSVIMEDIKTFYKDDFTRFCAQYSDVKELDKQFNSFDNFYREGSGIFPPLTFFHITRLIIARLANNPVYEKVVEKNFEALEYLWERDGGKYDRFDESKPEVFAAKYLRDLSI